MEKKSEFFFDFFQFFWSPVSRIVPKNVKRGPQKRLYGKRQLKRECKKNKAPAKPRGAFRLKKFMLQL